MPDNSVVTQGTDLKLGDGNTVPGPEAFTSIEGVTSINGFGTTRSEIDTTTLKAASKTFKLGLKDNGTLQIELNHDPADALHQDLKDLNDSGDSANFELVMADAGAGTYAFTGYVSQWALRADVDNVYKTQLSVRISGDVTYTP